MNSVPVGPPSTPAAQPPQFGASSRQSHTNVSHHGSDTLTFGASNKKKIKKKPVKALSKNVGDATSKFKDAKDALDKAKEKNNDVISKLEALKSYEKYKNTDDVRTRIDEALKAAKSTKDHIGNTGLNSLKDKLANSSTATKYVKKEFKDGVGEFKKKKMNFFQRLLWLPFKLMASVAGWFKGGRKTMVNILAKKA